MIERCEIVGKVGCESRIEREKVRYYEVRGMRELCERDKRVE